MVATSSVSSVECKYETPLAKPSRDLVYQFGKGDLEISASTMDFLMYLSPFVDLEGKIVIPLEQARYDLYMQSTTYDRVIREAKFHKLLIQNGNEYYSKFHVHTDGSDNRFDYVKLIQAYMSPKVHSYSLRYKRLFYYFISVTRMGNWQRFHIENLYKNNIRKETVGINYFDSFHELSDALLQLVQDGLIEIKLPDLSMLKNGFKASTHHEIILNAETPLLIERYYAYFGTLKGEKKVRTSLNKSKKNVIQVRISTKVKNDELKVSASETEFIQLAEKNSIAWNEIKSDSLNQVISYKNALFNVAGNAGLEIYRRSIQSFLSDQSFNLLHYDELNKLANYFMDFYLLKEIRNILIGAAYHQKHMFGLLQSDSELIVCNNYRVDFTTIGALLAFYKNRGSMNHIVLLDGGLMEKEIDYELLVFNHSQWLQLKDTVEFEYATRLAAYKHADSTHRPLHDNKFEWRRFMIDCAEKGLLVKKEAYEKLIKQKQLNTRSVKKHKVKPVPFYNWLIERD